MTICPNDQHRWSQWSTRFQPEAQCWRRTCPDCGAVQEIAAIDPAGSPHSSFPHRRVRVTPAAHRKLAGQARPCPHGCTGGHTEDEYYGGDCPYRVNEAFEGWGPG